MKFETSKELASYIGVSESCITRWLNLGMPHKMKGQRYEYDLGDVCRWLMTKSERQKRLVRALAEKLDKE